MYFCPYFTGEEAVQGSKHLAQGCPQLIEKQRRECRPSRNCFSSKGFVVAAEMHEEKLITPVTLFLSYAIPSSFLPP